MNLPLRKPLNLQEDDALKLQNPVKSKTMGFTSIKRPPASVPVSQKQAPVEQAMQAQQAPVAEQKPAPKPTQQDRDEIRTLFREIKYKLEAGLL